MNTNSKSQLFFTIILIFALVLPTLSQAITFDVIGPCSLTPLFKGSFKTDLSENAGKISMDIFDFNKIPYIGTQDGMNSIFATPTGRDAMEIISNTKMRAYGWCYSINGKLPNLLPSQSFLKKQSDHLIWFYAFSTYDNGIWLNYCIPSYTIKSPQFCKASRFHTHPKH